MRNSTTSRQNRTATLRANNLRNRKVARLISAANRPSKVASFPGR